MPKEKEPKEPETKKAKKEEKKKRKLPQSLLKGNPANIKITLSRYHPAEHAITAETSKG